MTGAPLLDVDGLGFSYDSRRVFSGWSHRFGPGLAWVKGPNGCGKSTLLKLLAGALEPFAGRRVAVGLDAAAQPQAYRQQVYWCGQDPIAFQHLAPAEYFDFLAGLYPSMDGAALPPLLDALGLAPFVGQRLETMSLGTGRKVAVAAALVMGTPVTLIDEPLAGVDQASMQVVAQALAQCARAPGRAWIVTSHEDLGAAAIGAAVLDLGTG